jgi:hypothetical protein
VNIPKKIPASPSSKKIRTGKEKNASSIGNEVFLFVCFFFLMDDGKRKNLYSQYSANAHRAFP